MTSRSDNFMAMTSLPPSSLCAMGISVNSKVEDGARVCAVGGNEKLGLDVEYNIFFPIYMLIVLPIWLFLYWFMSSAEEISKYSCERCIRYRY